MRLIDADAAIEAVEFGITYAKAIDTETGEVRELFKQSNEELRKAVERIKQLPSAEPEVIFKWKKEFREYVGSLDISRDDWKGIIEYIDEMPSTRPFYNITLTDVLKYIDDMPEDVWQEFTACLECRGWELQWCGGDFA